MSRFLFFKLHRDILLPCSVGSSSSYKAFIYFYFGSVNMKYLSFLFSLYVLVLSSAQDTSDLCDQLLPRCTVRVPCGMALHSYRISCRPELYGLSSSCSEICQQATISLATTAEGYDYVHCDCGYNVYCHTLRNRTASCWPNGADDESANSTSVGNRSNNDSVTCRVAEWMCTADQVCTVAWDYYRQLCRSMFAGVECSQRCNNSISILMRQRKAQKLHDCVCDGPEADACVQERTNILRLCYGQTDVEISPSSRQCFIPFLLLANIALAFLLA